MAECLVRETETLDLIRGPWGLRKNLSRGMESDREARAIMSSRATMPWGESAGTEDGLWGCCSSAGGRGREAEAEGGLTRDDPETSRDGSDGFGD